MESAIDPRNPAWRHGARLSHGCRPAPMPARRRGTGAMGDRRPGVRTRIALAPRCRSLLPRLALDLF